MKICPIISTPDLDRFATHGDAHLLLVHLIEPDNLYTKFYASRKELKILDNGLFEFHEAAPTSEILAKARLVGADVVIAPDVLYDAKGTVENAKNFAKAVDQENGIRRGRGLKPLLMMAVPQASTRKDYLWGYDQLANKMGYPWIGMSILACPRSFGVARTILEKAVVDSVKPSRIATYRALKETGLWNPKVNHHLLGLGADIDELEFFSPIKEIVSNDSSGSYLHGSLGIEYIGGSLRGGKRKEKLDFNQACNPKHYPTVLKNIEIWKGYAHFEPQGK